MAEKAEKKPEEKGAAPAAAPGAPAAKSAGGLLTSTPVLLGVVMAIEAGALLAGFKLLGGGPNVSYSAELAEAAGHGAAEGKAPVDKKKLVELPLLEMRAPNRLTKPYLYDVSIYVVTRGEHQSVVSSAITEREATIKDRIRTIIAQSDPDKLNGAEPGLETLRRQVKFQLDEILGEGMIEQVLVPRCIPMRTEF